MHTRNFSKTGLVIMALMFSLAASALSQQPNSSTHSMTFNGFDPGTYPIQTSLLSPAPLSISISGAPGAAGSPFILVQAAGLITPGFQVTPAEIVDIDPLTMTFIMDDVHDFRGSHLKSWTSIR